MEMVLSIEQADIDAIRATEISSVGFDIPLSDNLRRKVEDIIGKGGRNYVVKDGSEEVGFAVFEAIDEILYVFGLMLLPDIQGKGIAKTVIEIERQRINAHYLAFKTQSPHMWTLGRSVCPRWYPDNEETTIPTNLAVVTAKLIDALGVTFPINVANYGGPLYGTKPIHKDEHTQSWWDSICSFERGDSVLCVGQF